MDDLQPDDLRQQQELLAGVIAAIPGVALAVDGAFKLVCATPLASEMLAIEPPCTSLSLGSEVFRCLHAVSLPGNCGNHLACRRCELRNAVECAFGGSAVRQRECRMKVFREGLAQDLFVHLNAGRFDFAGRPLVLLTIEDRSSSLAGAKTLPVCACCRQIRQEDRQWIPMENYFRAHWNFRFSHGYCPHCTRELMSEAATPPARPEND